VVRRIIHRVLNGASIPPGGAVPTISPAGASARPGLRDHPADAI